MKPTMHEVAYITRTPKAQLDYLTSYLNTVAEGNETVLIERETIMEFVSSHEEKKSHLDKMDLEALEFLNKVLLSIHKEGDIDIIFS